MVDTSFYMKEKQNWQVGLTLSFIMNIIMAFQFRMTNFSISALDKKIFNARRSD